MYGANVGAPFRHCALDSAAHLCKVALLCMARGIVRSLCSSVESPCCSLVQREWRSWNVHKNKTKSCVAQCVYLFVAAFDTIVLCSLSCLVRVIQLVACACACAWLAHTLAHSHTHTLAHSHTRTLANSHTCTLAHSHTRTLAHTHTRTPVLSFFARQTHTHTAYIEPHAAVHTP